MIASQSVTNEVYRTNYNEKKRINLPGQKEGRIISLDGIRGVAVLMVIVFHYFHNQISDDSWLFNSLLGGPIRVLMNITYFFWSGVDLFFILSGFLIGNTLLKNRKSKTVFKTFYIRRFFRIIPIYYLLIACFLLLKVSPLYDIRSNIFSNPIPVPAYIFLIQNFYMAQYNHFGPQSLTPSWSLCVEEQFYLLIPFFVVLVNKKYCWIIALTGISIALFGRAMSTNYYEANVVLWSRIDSPMIGFLLAWLYQSANFREWISKRLGWVWGALVLMVMVCRQLYKGPEPVILGHLVFGIIFGLIVMIALYSKKPLLSKLLSNPFLLQMGKLSYFIYLYHQLINELLHLILLKQNRPVMDSYQAIYITLIAAGVTYLLAVMSYKYLEKPLIDYSHRFAY